MNRNSIKTNMFDKKIKNNKDIIPGIFIVVLSVCFVVILFAYSPWAPVGLVLLLYSLFVLRKWPEYGLVIILILMSSIVFQDNLPNISIGAGNIYIPDVFLIILLAIGSLKFLRSNKTITNNILDYIDIMLMIFLFFTIFSATYSIYYEGVSLTESLGRFRIISYYSLYFIIIFLIKTDKQVSIIIFGLCAVSAVVSIAMIIQANLGDSIAIIPGRIEPGVGNQATRILPPGQMLVYVMFVACSIYVVISENIRKRVLAYVLFSFCGIGVLLTYNRSYWVSYLLVLSIFFIFTSKHNRYKLFSRIVSPIIIFLMLFISISIFSPGQLIDNYFESIAKRVSSLFMGEELYESDSIDFRKEENVAAIEAISSKPFLGSGLGSKYRSIPDRDFESRESYIHNGYLWVVLKMGLLGAIPIILFFTFFITRIIKNSIHETNCNGRLLMLCGALAMLGILFINFVNPVIMQAKSIVVIAITMGLLRVLEKNSSVDSVTNDAHKNN